MKVRQIILLLFIFSNSYSQEIISSKVDRRVELFSIIFRLAGNPEYNMKLDKSYVNDIQTYFAKYDHLPVINFAKKLAEEKNMGFSRVMYLAVAVEFKGNRLTLIKGAENTLAGKWEIQDVRKFIELANDFYKRSAFENFFAAHKKYYADATAEFDRSITGFDENWYFNYYGEHSTAYQVVLGLGDGGANYGPMVKPVNKKKLVYAIMGSWTFTATLKPQFPKEIYLPYLVHEFNHSFIDHLLDDPTIAQQLEANGEILLKAQEAPMKLEGYEDWRSLVNESLVRASVVRYMIDHHQDEKTVGEEVASQTAKGFLWTKDLVALLGDYESNRVEYPAFKTFYPRIITFFKETALHLHEVK